MEKYFEAVKEHICSICIDSSDEGECSLTDEEICAVELYFPKILEVVQNFHGKSTAEYTAALREKICSDCKTSKSKNNCRLRTDSNCALDRYFPLIVETIQRIDSHP